MADLSMVFDPSDISSVASDASSAASDALSKAAAASSKIIAQSSAWEADTGWASTHLVTAYLSSDQLNITDTTKTLVQLDTEELDVGGNFNTGTHLFTVPHTGYYMIAGSIGWKPTVGNKHYHVSVVASTTGTLCQAVYAATHATDLFAVNCSAMMVSLVATETVGLYAYHSAGVNTPDINGTIEQTYLSILYLN